MHSNSLSNSSISIKYVLYTIFLLNVNVAVGCLVGLVFEERTIHHTTSKQRAGMRPRLLEAVKKTCDPSIPFQDERVPQWINGRRLIFIPSRKRRLLQNQIDTKKIPDNSETNDNEEFQKANKNVASLPPIVILGGMAQCIESWQHHFNDFSRERDIYMYEYLGSGLGLSQSSTLPIDNYHTDESANVLTEQSDNYNNVSIYHQAEELEAIIRQAVTSPCNSNNHTNIINTVHKQVDVVAFSLGARIALATMAKYPSLIRKAHLTGIAAQRETMGNMIFESWKDMLSPDQGSSNLRPFAWSVIMSTYSKTFLEENGLDKVLGWVDHICNNHHRMGLYHLLEQNRHFDPINDAQDVERSSRTEIQIAVGSQDVISTPEQAKRLNDALGSKNNIQIYEGCGHAVLNEHPRQWRNDVLTFLNK